VARRAAARRRALQRRRPRLSRLLAWLLAAWLGHAGLALAQVAPGALPGGGQVMVGSGQLLLSPNLLVIQQNSNRLGLDWQSFNIGSGAAVEFRQPDAGSVALNRVVGHSGSQIYGQLKANGQVFLTNPNGILFAPGSKVDVGGLVASTLDLSQADFADGRYVFNAVGAPGRVVNQGTLNASAGGYLALFGPSVDNAGDVSVHAGSVVLASGRAATVSISGSGLISAVVTPGTVAGSVDNSGRITADGGVVTLSAKSAQDIAASLVNNSGIVRANTLVEKAGEIWITGDQVTQSGQVRAAAPDAGDGGRILLIGDMARGSVRVAGALDASAAAGRGGFIETSAARVQVADGTRVTAAAPQGRAGTWLIDPTDFTVGASGALTTSGIGADTLAATLDGTVGGPAGTSVTLATAAAGSEAGDIHVNADVSWSAATTLTLQAHGHINLNASLTASGDGAGMVFTPGAGGSLLVNTTDSVKPKVTLSGANATLNIAGQDYTLVRDLAGLQAINSGLGGRYALVADIDASSTAGSGFTPIGNETSASVTNTGAFTGIFEGLGHGISGLTIERPTSNATGLFASTFGATLRNFELIGGSVAGSQRVGAVAGYTRGATTLTNVRSSASVSALDDSSSGVWAGGLVGHVEGSTAGVSITRSVSTGAVGTSTATATAFAGGLVGEMDTGVLSDVSAGGTITSTATGANDSGHHAGGLIGLHNGGNITSAAATGNVTGGRESGGLVGRLQPSASATLSQVSASGDVSGTGNVGGLVGYASGTGAVTNASATGSVDTSTSETVSFHAGGAIGRYSMTLAPSAVSAAGNVTGGNTTGGVVGWIESNVALGAGSLVSVDPVSGSKLVTGARWVGGLIGYSDSSSAFSGLSANAVVTATGSAGSVGGLIGRSNGAISNSSSSGSVSGGGDTGGLVGRAQGTGGLTNVSSSSTVTSTGTGGSVGGLVGSYTNSGSLNTASASGAVQGGSGSGSLTGGLVGTFSGGGSLVDGSTATTSTVAWSGRPAVRVLRPSPAARRAAPSPGPATWAVWVAWWVNSAWPGAGATSPPRARSAADSRRAAWPATTTRMPPSPAAATRRPASPAARGSAAWWAMSHRQRPSRGRRPLRPGSSARRSRPRPPAAGPAAWPGARVAR
jgi:filamentous hemagglutinin family protein